jgi:serine/threonine protein kinase
LIRLKKFEDVTPEEIIRFLNPELQVNAFEIRKFGSFLESTMKLDPDFRPSAAELLEHPWIKQMD